MTSASPLDLDALLEPISADAPCGEDLSFSAAFDRIAEARREDDPTLDQGEWVTSLKEATLPSRHFPAQARSVVIEGVVKPLLSPEIPRLRIE